MPKIAPRQRFSEPFRVYWRPAALICSRIHASVPLHQAVRPLGGSIDFTHVILPTPVLRAVALDDLGDAHVSVANVSIAT